MQLLACPMSERRAFDPDFPSNSNKRLAEASLFAGLSGPVDAAIFERNRVLYRFDMCDDVGRGNGFLHLVFDFLGEIVSL